MVTHLPYGKRHNGKRRRHGGRFAGPPGHTAESDSVRRCLPKATGNGRDTGRELRILGSCRSPGRRILAKLVNRMRTTVPALLLGTLVAAALTAGCSSPQSAEGSGSTISISTPATSTNAPPANPLTMDGYPVCTADGLTVGLGPVSNAMSYAYQAVDFTNTSDHSCAMSGFPTVSFAVDNGEQIGSAAVRDGAVGPVVILRRGQVAAAMLAIADPSMFPTDLCQPTAVDGLRVYPPGTTTAMYVARPGIACSVAPPSPQLTVQAVKTAG
jgi:hypothetical protein